jgi:hypothetical protein
MGYNPIPVLSENLYRYVAYLATFLKVTSIKQYLNVVRLLHVECGFANPFMGDVFLKGIIKGLRRVKGDAVNRKLPITLDILCNIQRQLDMSVSQDHCFWTACLLAFYGMFRKASLFPKGNNSSLCITLSDCHVYQWGVAIYTKQSKTIQFQERQAYVSLPWNANKNLCAARHLITCASRIPNAKSDTFVFSFVNKHSPKIHRITYNLFTSMLRGVLGKIGLPLASYTGHSFRRGGASLALKCGVPPEMIKAQGDWKSLSYIDYLDVNDCHDRAIYMTVMSNYP